MIKLNYGKGLREDQRRKGYYPVYGSNGIVGFHDKYLVEGPGIIIGRKGNVGSVRFSKDNFWPIDTTYYLTIHGIGDFEFWYYFLQTIKLDEMNTHSAVPGLNRENVYNLEIAIPDYAEQTAIANILSNLDTKIELNQQMNKTLESIAQSLFKHWFIDFEFPDVNDQPYKSSGGEMIDSELEMIPKGWHVSKIGKEFKTILGGTPSTMNKSYWENGTIPWINSGKINEFRIIEPSEYITENAVKESATKLMPKGTVVLAITGATLGQISIIEIDTCGNQSVVGIIPTEILNSEYLYFTLQANLNKLISNQTGGAQQHINKGNIENLQIIVPEDIVINKFKAVSEPIFENISKRCFENLALSKIRDLLLPKLMSGKIRVSMEETSVG